MASWGYFRTFCDQRVDEFLPLRFGSSSGGRRMPPSSPCAPWGRAAGRAVSVGVRRGVGVPPVLDPGRRSADRGNWGRGDVRVQVL